MSILEHLYEKYGKDTINSILEKLNYGDRNYSAFYQYISVSDHYNPNNFSHYKSKVIPDLNDFISDRHLRYELVNIIGEFNFEVKQYNTVITYGTFDLFHIGHLNLLKRAKSLCNTLIVGVSTDEFNELKGKHSTIPYDQRAAIVSCIQGVDKVIPESSWEQKEHDITQYHVDCFIIGSDWEGKFDYLRGLCEVKYLSRTDNISSTELRNILSKPAKQT